MKKYLLLYLAATLLGLGSFVSFKAHTSPNRYELAQRKTVLLKLADGQGSGVVIRRHNSTGTRLFVWTAAHVVEGSDEAKVGYYVRNEGHRVGEVTFKARVIFRSKEKDLALLWLDAPASYFGDARFDFDAPRVGQPQYHVGNFFGDVFDSSVSTGIVSGIGFHPDGNWPWIEPLDQTTCPAIFGSSGGPVFNADSDRVMGLIVGGPVGKGFIEYIPSREIRAFVSPWDLWAVVGSSCPSDKYLDIRVAACKVPATVALPPPVSAPDQNKKSPKKK